MQTVEDVECGVKAMREFLGALTDADLHKGLFVTLNGYTGEARQLADKHGIEMLNEAGLAKLLESVYGPSDLAKMKNLKAPRITAQNVSA